MLAVRTLFAPCAAMVTAVALYATPASAAGVRVNDLQLSCENGRTYVIRARGVSSHGELVTGYLLSAPRRGHYIRLIPMGDGYRYSGRGIWLDGKGATADLHLGKRRSYSCTVGTLT